MSVADVVKQTLALVKQAQGQPSDAIAKSINLATGLVAFDLQAPSKNLYPVNTPIRNRLPTRTGTARRCRWAFRSRSLRCRGWCYTPTTTGR